MKYKHKNISTYLNEIDPTSVFVEIGSERGEGSTLFLADLAEKHKVDLLTVDIIDRKHFTPKIQNQKNNFFTNDIDWGDFYKKVRDDSWPVSANSIDELPENLQLECQKIHNWSKWKNHSVKNTKLRNEIHVSDYTLSSHPSIRWFQEVGSEWSKKFGETINKKISMLYLDNFDYIWDVNNESDSMISRQIQQYKEMGFEMNNQNCQIEHLKQILYLTPYFDQNCVVALDDTYLYNDCWVGKSGPAVVYLLCHNFSIVYQDLSSLFVILKRETSK
jgi:hypothetical protein